MKNNVSCLQPGLDWTRLFMSLTAGAGTRCMSLLSSSPSLVLGLMHRFLLLSNLILFLGIFILDEIGNGNASDGEGILF